MVKVGKKIFVFAALIGMASCSHGMFEVLDRTTSDPFSQTPRVKSFGETNTMTVSWSGDEGADEYILERALDGSNLTYETVYRGNALSYADRKPSANDLERYIYRLSKRRGEKVFSPSPPAFGVMSLVPQDIHEPNDVQESATELKANRLVSNLYYFRTYNNLSLSDEDWYYVDILPKWQTRIVVLDSQSGLGNSTHFKIFVAGAGQDTVEHGVDIPLSNPENTEQRFYFKIIPDVSYFVANDMTLGVGGSIVQYEIYISGTSVVP
jgi:fibronectin type 3 domain-containing protein